MSAKPKTPTPCSFCDPEFTPPGSEDMDRCVISCLMQSPDYAVEKALEILKPDDFSMEACGLLFDIITRRHAKSELVDAVSLTNHLYDKGMVEKVGGPAFVSDCLTAAPNPAHVAHYAKEVLTASRKRQMLKIASELASAVVSGSEDSDDWRDALLPVLRRADSVMAGGKDRELITLKEVAIQYGESGVEKDLDPPVPTGIKRLDRMLEGGIRREYLLIGGRQGHGKSLLAMQVAGALANAGRRGLIIGYDMTALQVLMRDLARETRVPLSHVMGRVPFEGMEIQTITRGLARIMEGWDCYYTESPYVTLESIAAHARTLHRQKRLDFIVIDFLQSVPMKRVAKERSDEMLIFVSGQAEKLRKELNCTLIAPVQVNDDGLIRDARGILDAPQVFLRIEMEEITNDAGENEAGDNGYLKCLKNRFGKPNFSVPVFRNGAYQVFEDREMPEKSKPAPGRRARGWNQ